MLPSVVAAYAAEGFRVRLGSPRLRTSGVHRWGHDRYIPNFERLPLGDWGFTIRDFYVLDLLHRELKPKNALVIGNAYGMSAVCLAELMKPICVDVIDAEVLGEESRAASDLTRRVARRLDLDLHLHGGFSPQDLNAACRFEKYDLVFVDGLHTNEQIILDYKGIERRLADRTAVFFLHIGNLNMDVGWDEIKRLAEPIGLRP
ncbi:MAG: class I SAM-dependent methyltransferase, partial [Planctomycetota bacterium]|nr:class I SAM-dependent methyltransferase [Planctomycetota bacterium]